MFVARKIGVVKSTVQKVRKEFCRGCELFKSGRPQLIHGVSKRYMVRKITKNCIKSAKVISKIMLGNARVKASAQAVRKKFH